MLMSMLVIALIALPLIGNVASCRYKPQPSVRPYATVVPRGTAIFTTVVISFRAIKLRYSTLSEPRMTINRNGPVN